MIFYKNMSFTFLMDSFYSRSWWTFMVTHSIRGFHDLWRERKIRRMYILPFEIKYYISYFFHFRIMMDIGRFEMRECGKIRDRKRNEREHALTMLGICISTWHCVVWDDESCRIAKTSFSGEHNKKNKDYCLLDYCLWQLHESSKCG